jgi:hypothetical protein
MAEPFSALFPARCRSFPAAGFLFSELIYVADFRFELIAERVEPIHDLEEIGGALVARLRHKFGCDPEMPAASFERENGPAVIERKRLSLLIAHAASSSISGATIFASDAVEITTRRPIRVARRSPALINRSIVTSLTPSTRAAFERLVP